jgi:hypothetical protein
MVKKTEHPLDRLTNKLTDSIMQSIDHLPEAEIPFASVELSKEEQLEQYMEIRDDPQAWFDLLMEKGLKPVVEYAKAMEDLLKTHDADAEVDDANTEND